MGNRGGTAPCAERGGLTVASTVLLLRSVQKRREPIVKGVKVTISRKKKREGWEIR